MNRPYVVAITGASGAVYAQRLLQALLAAGRDVHLCISKAGQSVIRQELGLVVNLDDFHSEQLLPGTMAPLPEGQDIGTASSHAAAGSISYYHYENFFAPIASGSSLTSGMVICPCSGGTLSSVATGASNNLIHRAAEVHLKERRPLILVPRETPLSLAHINNLRSAFAQGATILPATPGWYHGVTSVQDLVDFVVARILDRLVVPHQLAKRWGANEE